MTLWCKRDSIMDSEQNIRVWDPLIRFSHWLLVACFFIAYLSEDDLMDIHVWAGYIIIALLFSRIIWGFIGSQYARFSDFVTPPATAFKYVSDSLQLKARRYIGHNPAGGLMIIVMLITLTLISITGLAVYGIEEQAGPLAPWLSGSSEWLEDITEELHEFFANLMILLVTIHLAGVVAESLLHRENLAKAMINGYKRK